MSFAIFAIKEVFLYHDIEKSRGLFFDKILSNKHTAPPIFNLTKHLVGCGIVRKKLSPMKVRHMFPVSLNNSHESFVVHKLAVHIWNF